MAAEEEKAMVVCFGDSITKRGYSEILAEALKVKAINAGVGGHNSKQGLHRIEKDVLAHKPDVVVVFFGTNDIRVDSERAFVPLKKYRENLSEISRRCQKAGAKVVFCTPPPIDSKAYYQRHKEADFAKVGGVQKLLADYRQAVIEVAKKENSEVVDLNQLLADKPEWMSPDGVHPGKGGTRLIARLVGEKVAPLVRKDAGK